MFKNRLFSKHLIPLFFICILLLSAFSEVNYTTETVKDIDGNIYRTIKIGDQVWMAENLKVTKAPDGTPVQSYFYMDDSATYGKYGRLYKWETAMKGSKKENTQGIAPEGWHIPSDADWQKLFDFLKNNNMSGHELLKGGKIGFDALLEGGADFRGNYLYMGKYSMFWGSTETNEQRAYHYGVSSEGKLDKFAAMKGARIAIRCIKNQ